MCNDATSERLYHASRIFWAWSLPRQNDKEVKGDCVYLVGCQKNKTLKIGLSRNPEKRLSQLQVSSPHPLKILAKVKGSRGLEQQLHKEFSCLKLSGEWFKWDDSIIEKFHLLSELDG